MPGKLCAELPKERAHQIDEHPPRGDILSHERSWQHRPTRIRSVHHRQIAVVPGDCTKEWDGGRPDVAAKVRVGVIVLFKLTKALGAVVITSGWHARRVWSQLVSDRRRLPGEPHVELADIVKAADRSDRRGEPMQIQPTRLGHTLAKNWVTLENHERARRNIEAVAKDGVVRGTSRGGLGGGLAPVTGKRCGCGRLYLHFDLPPSSTEYPPGTPCRTITR